MSRSDRLRFHLSDSIPHVVVAEGGLAREKAEDSVRQTVSMFQPNMIVAAGFSAGARDGHDSGRIVIGDRIVAVEGPPYTWNRGNRLEIETNQMLLNDAHTALRIVQPEPTIGSCLTAPIMVSNSAMKRWIGSTYDVATIDMESYWVAEAATRHSVPWLPIRVVLDPVDQDVCRLVGESLEDTRLRRAMRSAGHLVKHPGDLAGLLKLSIQVRRASAALAGMLAQLSRAEFATR